MSSHGVRSSHQRSLPHTPCPHVQGHELWVIILEKAWAKVHTSYQNIEGGDAGDVIAAFTGAPYDVHALCAPLKKKQPDTEPVWTKMLQAERSGFMMTASVPDHPTVDLLRVRCGPQCGTARRAARAYVSSCLPVRPPCHLFSTPPSPTPAALWRAMHTPCWTCGRPLVACA
jgi:hypothetical protein